MANLIRKMLGQSKILPFWELLTKSRECFKLEQLQAEQAALTTRCKDLTEQQRNVESMITDLTRCIRRMEFDIDAYKAAEAEATKASPK